MLLYTRIIETSFKNVIMLYIYIDLLQGRRDLIQECYNCSVLKNISSYIIHGKQTIYLQTMRVNNIQKCYGTLPVKKAIHPIPRSNLNNAF